MKPITDISLCGWLCAIVVTVMLIAPTGCAKPSQPDVTKIKAPESATGTTAARGVMRAGARNHRQAAVR